MSRVRRALLAAPLVFTLVWAALLCEAGATASFTAEQGNPEAYARALRRTPADPALHERLGASLALTATSPAQAQAALDHLEAALALRPTSAFAWAALAQARYRLGIADETFGVALVRAAMLGPHEGTVQETVAFYGLAAWDDLSPAARSAVDRMIAGGVRRDPSAMLRIAERRGRLDAVCRHLDAAGAAAAKPAPACKRREAIP